ncbi:PHP domain-containing protein [Micromonospora sp. NPDC049903]|uniref:PHP domain-containing protein n=1 Tax=Micromonospora sp. NPDC049903 TaxID=3364276 RepID=UPI0037B3F581
MPTEPTGVIADLHGHSRLSDGWNRPAELVTVQARAGVELVSLTDHDTLTGTAAAAARAAELGLSYVVGVEITAAPVRHDNHLLAHGVRADDPDLAALLATNRRIWRRDALAARAALREAGLTVPDSAAYDDSAALVMPHSVARDVIRTGRATHPQVWQVIDDALARQPPEAYAGMPEPVEIAEVVHHAGGLLVWAHPGRSRSPERMRAVLPLLDAIEVHTPRHDSHATAEWAALCAETGIPACTGRDHHGYPRYQPPPVPLDARYLQRLADRIVRPDGPVPPARSAAGVDGRPDQGGPA